MTVADHRPSAGRNGFTELLSRFSGIALAAAFYAALYAFPSPFLHRYFLGHPVAVAATILFCVAVGQLAGKYLALTRTRQTFEKISDRDLLPDSLHQVAGLEFSSQTSPAANPGSKAGSKDQADQVDPTAGRKLIRTGPAEPLDRNAPLELRLHAWLQHLEELPKQVSSSLVVQRARELLLRQKRRGHADQLNEDLRDLADRQADSDHDALQFVRIIVWAIPMLGFLGTVVGITQTLGGLDFTDGAAAVERLKTGLYVAFDTTALGLVLSVIAIFIQYPVEKFGQGLSQDIDARMIRLFPAVLAPEARIAEDDPLQALRQMTIEISHTLQASIQIQADLWRQTIDKAHEHWQHTATESTQQLRDAIEHSFGERLTLALRDHADALRRTQREGAEQIDNRWQQWQTVLSDNARILLTHQKTLLDQGKLLADSHSRARELERLQDTLQLNLQALDHSNLRVQESLQTATGAASMADAMMTLARAVDILAQRIPPRDAAATAADLKAPKRRNAA